MKKLILSLLMVLPTVASAQQVTIDIQMSSPMDATIQVNNTGMRVEFGGRPFARRIVRMTNGSVYIGSTMITNRGSPVTVVGMNPAQQTLSVQFSDRSIANRTLSELAVTNGCNQVFCVGEQLVTDRGSIVTVRGFYQNGNVAVEFSDRSIAQRDVYTLGLMESCSAALCTGDTVITDRGSVVRVVGFFADGMVAVQFSDRSIAKRDPHTLSMTEAVCGNIYINRVTYCGR